MDPQTENMDFYLSMGKCTGYLSLKANLDGVVGNIKRGNINRDYVRYLHDLLGKILTETEETDGQKDK